MNRFEKCLEFVLKKEGGFVNNPYDKGGMTYKGICRKFYPALQTWNIIDSVITDGGDVKKINYTLDCSYKAQEEIKEIYRNIYWKGAGCDLQDEPLDLIVFDTAVNMGCNRAKEFLSHTIEPDCYLVLRLDYYKKIVEKNPRQEIFLKGWTNRVKDLMKETGVKVEI